MESEKRKIVVVGASRGIGAAVAQHFTKKGDSVFSISRGQPIAGKWIQADISTPEGIKSIVSSISESTVDALLFMGGVWENGAFTDQYDFMTSSDQETRFVIAVNTGVAESGYEYQFCTYPKVSLSLAFKNLIKEDSYLKSATPK